MTHRRYSVVIEKFGCIDWLAHIYTPVYIHIYTYIYIHIYISDEPDSRKY